VVEWLNIPEISTGKIGGFDFGLKTFLTDHEGTGYISQEYLRQELGRIQSLSRSVSTKKDGSHNQRKARWMLHRTHIRIADKRQDSHFKLAHQLCDQFAVLVFEDLNIDGMKRLWGRKVSDLGFRQFIEIVQWVALKRGLKVIFIDRFEPTSQLCSQCQYQQKLTLVERVFNCPNCGLQLDRDHNAALNIQRIGTSIHTKGVA
jgi:putative transposase